MAERRKPSQYAKLIGALELAGAGGASLNDLQSLFWTDVIPKNWRIIIALRVTRARKEGLSILCEQGVYRLAPQPLAPE